MKIDFEWIEIPSGRAIVGSTMPQIDRAVREWEAQLLDPDYVPKFRSWITKEYPQHEVELSAFAISDIPVTNGLYRQYCEATDHPLPESLFTDGAEGRDDHPVWGVTFAEAKQFAAWLSAQVGYEVRLPTEAEWEYAARGSSDQEYPWGEGFSPERCNTVEAGIGHTSSVRTFSSGRSVFGLYDMGGNVEEWVDTLYGPHPGGERIEDDLTETLGERYPLLKGGSFARGGDLARVARRHGGHPSPMFRFTGFRLVRPSTHLANLREESSHA